MKFSLVSVIMIFGGGILLYSGVKGYDPRDVIQWGLGGKKPEKLKKEDFTGSFRDQLAPNEQNPDPGQRYPGDVGIPDPSESGRAPA